MAQIVTITNPLTGQPAQVDQLDHTAQQIDDGLNIARGVSNPNLLDNWYFGNPVNQRNVSGTIDTVGYFLDRWKLVSGSVTIGSNGITLNGTIVQILETAVGTDVPASALTTEGVVVASYDNNSKTFSLTGTGQTFVAAKLELGDTQTLAHQDSSGKWVLNGIPDYGEQLALCQRRQYFFNPNGKSVSMVGNGQAYRSDVIFVNFTLPTPMAEEGTPILENLDTSKIQLRGAGQNLIPTSVGIDGASHGSSFSIICGVSGATAGAAYDMILFDYNNLGITNNL